MNNFKVLGLILLFTIFLSGKAFAHSLVSSPINYPDSVTKAMCEKKKYITEKRDEVKNKNKEIDEINNEVKYFLANAEDYGDKEYYQKLNEKNRSEYSKLYNIYFQILMNYADILESTCMDDDGYYWIKTNNSKLKEFYEKYNQGVADYEKFLKEELLPELKKINIENNK